MKMDWIEKGFYGYQCSECTNGRSAFIILADHKGFLSDEERATFNELIEKYYPDLEPKGMSDRKKICLHWYDFLVAKKEY
jgi:hypothetical protein